MRVALLTNFVAPYQVPVLEDLRDRVGDLRVLVSTRMEADRSWVVDWRSLDVVVQRTLTFRPRVRDVSGLPGQRRSMCLTTPCASCEAGRRRSSSPASSALEACRPPPTAPCGRTFDPLSAVSGFAALDRMFATGSAELMAMRDAGRRRVCTLTPATAAEHIASAVADVAVARRTVHAVRGG